MTQKPTFYRLLPRETKDDALVLVYMYLLQKAAQRQRQGILVASEAVAKTEPVTQGGAPARKRRRRVRSVSSR